MLASPLFREFHEPNKTQAKIGRNYYSISNCMVLIRQNKGAKITLHAKSPTFRAAKLKVLQYASDWVFLESSLPAARAKVLVSVCEHSGTLNVAS